MLSESFIATYIETLRSSGVLIQRGLSDGELSTAENRFEFLFPPDLKELLKHGLPVSEKFPDWRSGTPEQLSEWLNWPFDGMCFDIEHNKFWMDEWGAKPTKLTEAFAVAKKQIHKAPKLIPIYVHRFIPAEPSESGNPVFSVYQTDIIYYGTDLASYLSAEFGFKNPFPIPNEPKPITFWSNLVELNNNRA
ncbi:MAG: SMI1/KNR4 family protein [Verrucomicrobiota bacterium]